jgi:hypothetical protein
VAGLEATIDEGRPVGVVDGRELARDASELKVLAAVDRTAALLSELTLAAAVARRSSMVKSSYVEGQNEKMFGREALHLTEAPPQKNVESTISVPTNA